MSGDLFDNPIFRYVLLVVGVAWLADLMGWLPQV